MKTSIDIPEDILVDIKKYSKSVCKKEAIITALTEYIQKRKMAEVCSLKGSMNTIITHKELTRLREKK